MKTEDVAKRDNAAVAESRDNGVQWTRRPRVAIRESTDDYVIDIEMPGVGENDVDVRLEGKEMKVLGRVQDYCPRDHERRLIEYQPGNYERSFQLTDTVDPEKIEAVMKHGLLTVRLPKREAAKPKRIAVAAG